MASPERPFAGRKMTRRERRASERRAKARADALAKAMPPPATTDRVDPITGRPLHAPGTTPALATTPAPAVTTPPARPKPAGTHQMPTGPVAAGPTRPATADVRRASPDSEERPTRRGRKRRTVPAPAPEPAAPVWDETAFGGTPRRRSPLRLLTPVGDDQAGVNVVTGLVLLTFGFMVAVAFGLPVLNHGWQPEPLAGGLLLGLVGTGMVARGWAHSGAKLKAPTVLMAALLVTSFGVGVASDPVVIDGRVLLNTSKEAKSARLLTDIYTDLRTMADFDVLLAADLADARARVSEYDPAVRSLTDLSTKYATLPVEDLPDPAFADLVASMKAASYWQTEAMKAKRDLIEQDDSRKAADLATWRAAFTESWLAASTKLQDVAFALNIPVEDQLKGPHE